MPGRLVPAKIRRSTGRQEHENNRQYKDAEGYDQYLRTNDLLAFFLGLRLFAPKQPVEIPNGQRHCYQVFRAATEAYGFEKFILKSSDFIRPNESRHDEHDEYRNDPLDERELEKSPVPVAHA